MSGRIPQRFIDELLSRLDIVDVVDARVPLKKAGKNYQARCPFHDEKSPSFSVNQDKQFYYCFGCGAGGNAIGFVMEYERLEFPAAIEKLATSIGLEIPREAGTTGPSLKQTELINKIDAASQWFQRQLREHKAGGEARDYLKNRGLTGEIAKQFGIGFAPPGWDNLLRALGTAEDQQKLLLEAGLVIKRDDGSGLYDRFRHRVMFPIRDNRGRVVAFGGRVLTDEKPKYLNSPESSVFHKSNELYGLYEARRAHRDLDQVLVVEGYMDVVMLAQHGVRNAVATLGTSLTTNHLQRLFRYTPHVIFCFDGDDAGRRAAARSLELTLPTLEDGRQASFLFLPEGDDPDSLVQRIGADAFRTQLASAMPLTDFMFEHYATDIDLNSTAGKARFSKLVIPAINRVAGMVLKTLLRSELASRIGMDPAQLPEPPPTAPNDDASDIPFDQPPPEPPPFGEENHWAATPPAAFFEDAGPQQRVRSATPLAKPAPSRGLNPVRMALRILLQQPGVALKAPSVEGLETLENPNIALLQKLVWQIQDNPDASTGSLLGYWYGSEEGELLTRLATEDHPVSGDLEHEFHEVLQHLQQRIVQTQQRSVQRELEQIPFSELTTEQKQAYLASLTRPEKDTRS